MRVCMPPTPCTALHCTSAAAFQAASHVQFMIARTRMLANLIGFLPATPERAAERAMLTAALVQQLGELRTEYSAMLYGGTLLTAVRSLQGSAEGVFL